MQHLISRPIRPLALLAVSAAMAFGLAGCSGSKDKSSSQAAARVNKGEITVLQINQVLEQQRGLKPEQVEQASRDALERLIDQELAVQQAESQKLDRQPRVVAAIEAAKHDIIARAYIEKLGESVARPTPNEVQQYFDSKPGLFANRRVYNLQDIAIEVAAERRAEVQAQIAASKSLAAFGDWLKAQGLRVSANQTTQAAESLPLSMVDQLAALNEGQSLILPTPVGLRVIWLLGVKPVPVTLEQARPAIEQFMLNERKRSAAANSLKDLRSSAKIEYIGKFADKEPAAAPVAAPPASTASGALDDAALKKGLGLK